MNEKIFNLFDKRAILSLPGKTLRNIELFKNIPTKLSNTIQLN